MSNSEVNERAHQEQLAVVVAERNKLAEMLLSAWQEWAGKETLFEEPPDFLTMARSELAIRDNKTTSIDVMIDRCKAKNDEPEA